MESGDRQCARSMDNQRVCPVLAIKAMCGRFLCPTEHAGPRPCRLPAPRIWRRKGHESEERGGTPEIFANGSGSEKERREGESRALISDEKTAENLENEIGARSLPVSPTRLANCPLRACYPPRDTVLHRRYAMRHHHPPPCATITARATGSHTGERADRSNARNGNSKKGSWV